jgi:hypothetical protein
LSFPEIVQAISRAMDLSPREIERRKAFLQLSERDAALLAAVHDRLVGAQRTFVDGFYTTCSRSKRRAFLPDQARSSALSGPRRRISRASAGVYGADYVQNRLRVGVARTDRSRPKWYLGAYSHYLCTS